MNEPVILVLISANGEWQAIKEILDPEGVSSTPLGETFIFRLPTETPDTGTPGTPLRFFHGGWGKISAAATAQYVIDHYQPDLLINLGTCGGFEGRIQRGTIILVTKTIVYDIIEQMFDPADSIAHYSTDIDLSWMADEGPGSQACHGFTLDPGSSSIVRGLLVSADRDIIPTDIPMLVQKYGAIAADWESGAIAWTANRNHIRCLILRGVTDLVGASGGEAYADVEIFRTNTRKVLRQLVGLLPVFLKNYHPAVDIQPLFIKVDCIELRVPDLESGLAFYQDRLGHTLLWRTPQSAGLRMPDGGAELVLQTERPGQDVDLTVRSAELAARQFEQAGGTVVVQPFDIQIGRACVVQDPWGNRLVLLDISKGLLKTDAAGNVIGNL